MLGSCKVGGFHHSFVKASQVFKVYEIECFNESEIMWSNTIYVIHQYPFVFTDTLPYVRSFTCFGFKIIPSRVELIISVRPVRNSMFDTRRTIMGNIKQVIFVTHFRNVSVNGRSLFIRIFE